MVPLAQGIHRQIHPFDEALEVQPRPVLVGKAKDLPRSAQVDEAVGAEILQYSRLRLC